MLEGNSNAAVDGQQHVSNGTARGKQSMSTGRTKAKRVLPTLLATGQQERKSLKIQGSIAANAQAVADNKFPLNAPFVTSPDSSELFIKLDKHSITSLFSQQKYSSAGVSGYLVSLS